MMYVVKDSVVVAYFSGSMSCYNFNGVGSAETELTVIAYQKFECLNTCKWDIQTQCFNYAQSNYFNQLKYIYECIWSYSYSLQTIPVMIKQKNYDEAEATRTVPVIVQEYSIYAYNLRVIINTKIKLTN